jgi:hypothetical protein
MLYAVRIRLPLQQVDDAVRETRDEIEGYDETLDQLSTKKLNEVYSTVMEVALRPYHDWLEKHGMIAVISAAEDSNSDSSFNFNFYFDNAQDAASFKQEFLDIPVQPDE